MYSLALSQFYSIRESSTTIVWNVWNVTEVESVNQGPFLFISRSMPFCILIPPRASCDLFFLDLEREARVLFVKSVVCASTEKREVRDCCSFHLFVFDLIEELLKRVARAFDILIF